MTEQHSLPCLLLVSQSSLTTLVTEFHFNFRLNLCTCFDRTRIKSGKSPTTAKFKLQDIRQDKIERQTSHIVMWSNPLLFVIVLC